MPPRSSDLLVLLAVLFAAAPLAVTSSTQSEQFTLARCAEGVRVAPDERDGYICYWAVSRQGEQDAAVRALEALLSITPEHPLALYYLAHIERDRGNERALDLYSRAAAAHGQLGDYHGQTIVLRVLAEELRRRNRMVEAEQILDRALAAARATEDSGALVMIRCAQARFLRHRGDYGAALVHLHEAEELAFPGGSDRLKMDVVTELALVYIRLDRYSEAHRCFQRKIALRGGPLISYEGAYDHYMVTRLAGSAKLQSGEMSHQEYVRSLEQSLEIAIQAGHRALEATIRDALGRRLDGPRAIEEIELALEIARSTGNEHRVRPILRSLALALREEPDRRDEALSAIDEAISSARAVGELAEIADSLFVKTELFSPTADREHWMNASRNAIEAVEDLLDRQPESRVRARVLHRWARLYTRYSGLLLASLDESPDPAGDLDAAFRTIETMRGRVLIEELELAGIETWTDAERFVERRLSEVLAEIARTQRELADPLLDDERQDRLDALLRAEKKERDLRDRLARARQRATSAGSKPVPGLEEIQRRLAADQAVLSFQLANRRRPPLHRRDNGGSWLLVITRDDAAAFALEDEDALHGRLRIFLGLCRRGDGSEAGPGSVLYDGLIDRGLQRAGPSIRRLIIVPYGELNRLPFAALRSTPKSEPLGSLYEITQVPSVALWLDWAQQAQADRHTSVRVSALALADPELVVGAEEQVFRAGDPWIEGLRLGPLPRARSEAKELIEQVGGDSRMLAGAEATEHVLKQIDLTDYGILHLATHAVVDYDRPMRSAILLGPGDEQEDGFLQSREIAELDLRGKAVILSSCRSASGQVIRGEGVLSLARAFFRAGSRAVIGNLWPMRDEDAEALMREFSRGIAAGDSLSTALRRARQKRIAAGAPAAAWAGVVLLGDGDYVPKREGIVSPDWAIGALLLAAAVLACAVFWRLRRDRSVTR